MSLAGNSSCVTNPGHGPRPFPYPVGEPSPQSLFLQHKVKIIFKNIHCIQHFFSRSDFYVTQRDGYAMVSNSATCTELALTVMPPATSTRWALEWTPAARNKA